MLRQRLRNRRFPIAQLVTRLLVVLAALASIWYGVMTILLAAKVSPRTVNDISAYRTIYDYFATLTPRDIDSEVRIIVGIVGFVVFLIFAFVGWRALPRPYLARGELDITEPEDRGSTVVAPRAIERAAEAAALEHRLVTDAAGRYGTDDLSVAVTVRQAQAVADTLSAVQRQVADALQAHDLPAVPVNVTLVGFDR